MNYWKLWNFATDFLFTIWFFWRVHPSSNLSRRRVCAGYLLFLLLIPLYLLALTYQGEPVDTLIRFFLRWGVYSGYVYLVKGRSLSCSLYFGVLAWLVFTTANCLLLTPTLYPLHGTGFWTAQLMEFCFTLLTVTLCSRLVPLNEIAYIGWPRVYVMVVLVCLQLYLKASLGHLSTIVHPDEPLVLTSYPFILQLLLLSAIIFFEWYQHSRYQQENARLSDVANRYRYEYAQVSADADANLRQIHHDLKNHLYAIQRLSNHSNQELQAYIQSLTQDLGEYESLVDSGNDLLDGLLSHKIRLARSQNIPITVQVDFSQGGFLQDKDMCALFGNALDNALEASAAVQNPDLRSILVKCQTTAGNLVLTVANYYEGELKQVGRRILTRKQEPGHGVGLSSISRTAGLYQGTVTHYTDPLHNFVLVVAIPIPPQA